MNINRVSSRLPPLIRPPLVLPTLPLHLLLLPRQHRRQPLLHLLLRIDLRPPRPIDPQTPSNPPPQIPHGRNIKRPQTPPRDHHRKTRHVDRGYIQSLESFHRAVDVGAGSVALLVEFRERGFVASHYGAPCDECGEGEETGAREEEPELFA